MSIITLHKGDDDDDDNDDDNNNNNNNKLPENSLVITLIRIIGNPYKIRPCV